MGRKYELKRRAESQDETRRRIVEAAAELHGTVGPSHTTVMAVAEKAGVERPTVYRHFPTLESLLTACSSHHWAENTPPDPEPWLAVKDPEARLRRGLAELFAYYARHEKFLWNILRDLEDMPELRPFAARRIAHRQRMRDVLAGAWPGRGPRRKFLTAAVGHAIEFFAWRSLHRQGLSSEEIIDVMIALVRGARM